MVKEKVFKICKSIMQLSGLQKDIENRVLGWTVTPIPHPIMVDFEEGEYILFHWEDFDMHVHENLILQGFIMGQMAILAPDWKVQKDYNNITAQLSFYPKK